MQFDTDGTYVAQVQWFFAADNAGYFPGFHRFGSQKTWSFHGQPGFGPGEVYNALTPYSKGAMPGYFPGTGNFCGPIEWWQDGCPSDAPPLDYSSGVPPCCPQPLCQPFWENNVAHTSITSVNPSFAWEWVQDGAGGIFFVDPSGMNEGTVEEFGGLCAFGQLGTFVQLSLVSSPLANDMTLIAYDPATYTGTYQFTDTSLGPPGFLLFVTMTPP